VGDDGGAMVNGGSYDGTIDLADLDPWTFTANAADSIILRLGSVGFNGQFFLYGPDGTLDFHRQCRRQHHIAVGLRWI
jgi:hypothetical protein